MSASRNIGNTSTRSLPSRFEPGGWDMSASSKRDNIGLQTRFELERLDTSHFPEMFIGRRVSKPSPDESADDKATRESIVDTDGKRNINTEKLGELVIQTQELRETYIEDTKSYSPIKTSSQSIPTGFEPGGWDMSASRNIGNTSPRSLPSRFEPGGWDMSASRNIGNTSTRSLPSRFEPRGFDISASSKRDNIGLQTGFEPEGLDTSDFPEMYIGRRVSKPSPDESADDQATREAIVDTDGKRNMITEKTSSSYTVPTERLKHYISSEIGHLYPTFYEMTRFAVTKETFATVRRILNMCTSYTLPVTLTETQTAIVNATRVKIFTGRNIRLQTHLFPFLRTYSTIENVAEEMEKAKEPVLIIADVEDRHTYLDYFSAINAEHELACCILFVGKNEELECSDYSHNTLVGYSTPVNMMKAIDDLLERYGFSILRNFVAHLEYKRLESKYEHFHLLDVYENIRCAYKRSEVPKSEWPLIPEEKGFPDSIENAIRDVIAANGVFGCSKTAGRLLVYMVCSDSGQSEDKKNDLAVEEVLAKYKIASYKIIQGTFKQLNRPGDPVLSSTATLGGFAENHKYITENSVPNQVNTPTADSSLFALVSRHAVVNFKKKRNIPTDQPLILTTGTRNQRIGEIRDIHENDALDILPVPVDPCHRRNCKPTFRTENNQPASDQMLYTGEWDETTGWNVHFWGLMSKPGLGTIVFPQMPTSRTSFPYVVIMPRSKDHPFSQDGDSGSIICASRRNVLYALAMLRGEYTPKGMDLEDPFYVGVPLKKALEELSDVYKCDFKLYVRRDNGSDNSFFGMFKRLWNWLWQY